MSHIFDTLRRIEGERNGVDTRIPTDAVDLLELTERGFPPQSETTFKASSLDANRPTLIQEQRLRVVGSPLSVGGKASASAPATEVAPADPAPIPPVAPLQAAPAIQIVPLAEAAPAVTAPSESIFESPAAFTPTVTPIWAPPHPLQVRQQASRLENPTLDIQAQETPLQETELQETPEQAVPLPVAEPAVTPIQEASIPEPPAQADTHQESPAAIQSEPLPTKPAEELQVKLPTGVVRAISIIRTALPIVKRIMPIFEGNVGAAVSNLLAPYTAEPAAPQLAPIQDVDFTPIQNGLAELKAQQCELGDQIFEQGQSFQRIDDQLELMRQSTDRNTLEQQELIEELKDVGKKANFVVWLGLGLLGISVVLETILYLHLAKVLR